MTAGAELFRRNGYTGTGLKQIVTAANAPFGSLYHFFPGGKEQLGEEVIRHSGMLYAELFDIFITPAEDVVSGIEAAFAAAAVTLRETDYADACPIATIALEVASTSEPLRQATADVFSHWIAKGTEAFQRFGLPEDNARKLTVAVITSLEGAFVLSRSLRDTEPLAVAGEAAAATARHLMKAPDAK
ncbi:TetR/AcrR family transcriptional regulator [Amycolatopsis acidiphila]|uniref:TetR/AcrR family transcriptional regulator n=1 Tax=Amycolatopsis acidiphila TaxID=715473 RepID=A0A558A369_9PSEU|nr:TetR/AcrR family transcriptional regulator [Amycolatopsis acidiphila]TVT18710.1 TetR/AcrR family transcriptional regulator [Amycolatopsis acidiphila]UIJ63788.1 TetR/AcrR family transcriptional regulator [Amycolatopsis acidiphila]GHG59179.1 TetR family transcriptional regulator [Amycolatopsis acidiphila]